MTKSLNANLHRASRAKNDEFYTRLEDIEEELVHYWEHFKGKVVYCNCDDPTESNFFHYFSFKFKELGLKRLIATSYSGGNGNSKIAYCLIYDGEQDGNEPDLQKMGVQFLEGDGDFRSPECVELLKQADIVCTNPPFSLFREYVDQLIRYKKQFLIIGNDNAVTYKGVFRLIKENQIWLGRSKVKEFVKPDGSTQKFGNVGWFTNLEAQKGHRKFIFIREYEGNEQAYPKYDDYDAIEVSRTKDIPVDYNGVMGVPISFLGKYDPSQFEILACMSLSLHNRTTYKRLLIRRKE